jgi:hypothetical protein
MTDAALQLFRAGHLPVLGEWLALPLIRHAGSTHIGDAAFDAIFHPVARRLVARCDACLRIGGASAGADEMVALARAHGLAVYHALDEVPRPVEPTDDGPPTPDRLRELEHERTRALVARDMPTIERLHAAEYQLVTPSGTTFTRERYLAALAAGPFYAGWELGPIAVRLSPAMALLRYAAVLRFPSGGVVTCWHTDSYERRDGRWQAVWSQATERRTPADATAAA